MHNLTQENLLAKSKKTPFHIGHKIQQIFQDYMPFFIYAYYFPSMLSLFHTIIQWKSSLKSDWAKLSMTLLSILAGLSSAVFLTASILPQIYFLSLFNKFFRIISRAPTITGILIILMFHKFLALYLDPSIYQIFRFPLFLLDIQLGQGGSLVDTSVFVSLITTKFCLLATIK